MADLGFPKWVGGEPTLEFGTKIYYFAIFPENCIKMTEIGPGWGVLDPPVFHVVGAEDMRRENIL